MYSTDVMQRVNDLCKIIIESNLDLTQKYNDSSSEYFLHSHRINIRKRAIDINGKRVLTMNKFNTDINLNYAPPNTIYVHSDMLFHKINYNSTELHLIQDVLDSTYLFSLSTVLDLEILAGYVLSAELGKSTLSNFYVFSNNLKDYVNPTDTLKDKLTE